MAETIFGVIGAIGVLLTIFFYFRGDKNSSENKKAVLTNLEVLKTMDKLYAGKDLDAHTEAALSAIRKSSNWEVYKYSDRSTSTSLRAAIICMFLFVGFYAASALVATWVSANQVSNEQTVALIGFLNWCAVVFEVAWFALLFAWDGGAKRVRRGWNALEKPPSESSRIDSVEKMRRRSRSILTLGMIAAALVLFQILGLFQQAEVYLTQALLLCIIIILIKALGIYRSWSGGSIRTFAEWSKGSFSLGGADSVERSAEDTAKGDEVKDNSSE